jgi:Flp pilus assembly protein CpaB
MNPKLVAVMVVAALLIGLLVGAGGGIIGATFVHRLNDNQNYRGMDWAVAPSAVTVVESTIDETEPIPVVPPGQRAVSIKVGVEKAVAGFILPGRKVDVVHVRPAPERQMLAETIIQDVQVLAINRGGDETLLVTLSLTPEQAEDLAKAQNDGTLSLVLRK